jgi:hypothetical protein
MNPADLRALLAAATPGPWKSAYYTNADAVLIVAAVNALPALLDRLEKLEGLYARVVDGTKDHKKNCDCGGCGALAAHDRLERGQ